jgi:hypothetical protein
MSIRGVHLKDLGKPALLQLQNLGYDVTKYLTAKPSGIDPRLQYLFKMYDRDRLSKYNVSAKASRKVDNILFASKLEANVYRCLKQQGIEFEMQKVYIIEEGFEHAGRIVRPVKYVCDFYIPPESRRLVLDAKGLLLPLYKLKEKLFLKKFGFPITVVKNLNDLMLVLNDHGLLKKYESKLDAVLPESGGGS